MRQIEFKDWKEVEDYTRDYGNLSYYSAFPTIWSHFCCGVYSGWVDNGVLLFRKYKNIPRYYIPFRVVELKFENAKLIKSILLHPYKPAIYEYIYNNDEIVYNINSAKFKKIRNSINYVERNYPELTITHTINENDFKNFIDGWVESHRHYWRLTYRRDLFLLECMARLLCTFIYDGQKLVGAEINYPHPLKEDLIINIFRKHDIAYKNMHEYVRFKGAEYCASLGFKWSNDCDAGDKKLKFFKDKFLGEKGYMYPLGEKVYE